MKTAASQRRRLSILLALNAAMITGLVAVGILAHSVGVLAAGGDYIADSSAIVLGVIAVTIRARVGEHSQAPTYVAMINASALLIITVLAIIEAARRLLGHTPHVHGLPVLIVSTLATIVMIAGVLVIGTDAGAEDLHMRSVLLDTAADALASAAVAVSGAVIYLTHGLYWLDPALAIVIGLIIGAGAIHLLRDVVTSLRTATPLRLANDD